MIPTLLQFFPEDFDGRRLRYFEPFVGGGALAIALGDPGHPFHVSGQNLVLNDSNPDLVLAYSAVRDQPEELMNLLDRLSSRRDRQEYETIRALVPTSSLERAARFIYLNRTCFNGLWRVNSRGEFNVPYGRLKNPLIYERENILALAARFSGTNISCLDFEEAVVLASEGDLVYFDPPYIPLTPTASFSQYAKAGFSVGDQMRLAKVIERLIRRGVRVLLSNSSAPKTYELFGELLDLHDVIAKRSISARPTGRAAVVEVIGTSIRPLCGDS